MTYDIRIEDQPTRRLAALAHRGAYTELPKVFRNLSALISERDLWRQIQAMACVSYDDPETTPTEDCRSFAAVVVGEDFPVAAPLEEMRLPSGPYAVLRYKGPYTGLSVAYKYFYRDWLPASGQAHADAAPFEIYLNDPGDTAPEDLLTDIFMPLEAVEG